MTRSLFVLIACVLLFDLDGQTVWESNFGLPDSTFAIDILPTNDGNYLLYGGTYSSPENLQAFLLKFSPSGEQLWIDLKDYSPLAEHYGGFISSTFPSTMLSQENGQILLCGERTALVSDTDGAVIWESESKSIDAIKTTTGEYLLLDGAFIHRLNGQGAFVSTTQVGTPFSEFIDYASYTLFGDSLRNYREIELSDAGLVVLGGAIGFDNGFFYTNNGFCITFLDEDLNFVSEHITSEGPAWPMIANTLLMAHMFVESPSTVHMFSYGSSGSLADLKCTPGSILDSNYPIWYPFNYPDGESPVLHFTAFDMQDDEDEIHWVFHEQEFLDDHHEFKICLGGYDKITNLPTLEGFARIGEPHLGDKATCMYRHSDSFPLFLSGIKDTSFPPGGLNNLGDGEFYVARIDSISEDAPLSAISGTVYLDLDEDSNFDWDEPRLEDYAIIDGDEALAITNSNGAYALYDIDLGEYQLSASSSFFPESSYTISSQNPLPVALTESSPTYGNADFGVIFPDNTPELNLTLNSSEFNPGFEANLHVNISGVFPAQFDSISFVISYDVNSMDFVSSPIPTTSSNNEIKWSVDDSAYTLQLASYFRFGLSPDLNSDPTFNIQAVVHSLGQAHPFSASFTAPLSGSYDPNDKQVSPAGIGESGQIPLETERLEYTIRFQNTGTDTTHFIRIHDPIDLAVFDISGFEFISASHEGYEVSFIDGELRWTWDPIYLPDSTTNPLESQGFVKFSLPLKDDLSLGDLIENKAYIYFDYNPAIITPVALNTLGLPDGIDEETLENLFVFQNSGQLVVQWNEGHGEMTIALIDIQGRRVRSESVANGRQHAMDLEGLKAGTYLVSITDANGKTAAKKVWVSN